MSKIKLEVGKTYRSRKGEEVKIARNDNTIKYPCKGSDDRWYTENGRFDLDVEESSCDLIEEVPSETRHTFNIPNGVKKVTVERLGNRIVVEMVPEKEPKPGDVLIDSKGNVYIFKSVVSSDIHKHFAWFGKDGRSVIGSMCTPGRPATPEEAQPLWDALKKAEKRWNAEAMQVEDVPERERIMEYLQDYVNNTTWNYGELCSLIEGYLNQKEGEK